MIRRAVACGLALAVTGVVFAQENRPKSPRGTAETQIGEHWIEIAYGRPIKRGRTNVFGAGAEYGKAIKANAPVWRAGADVSTRIKTPVSLQIGGKAVPAGEYSLFIDPKENDWTLIVSSWGAKKSGKEENPNALWGAYNYTPDKDVARVKMTLTKLPFAVDQLTWGFADVTMSGGKLVIMWDDVAALAPFTLGK